MQTQAYIAIVSRKYFIGRISENCSLGVKDWS